MGLFYHSQQRRRLILTVRRRTGKTLCHVPAIPKPHWAISARLGFWLRGLAQSDLQALKARRRFSICGRPPPCKVFCSALIKSLASICPACFVRSHMNAGQGGFRDKSSKQKGELIEGHWKMRSFSRRGSIDHTICSLSCKFWHQLSTVAVELLPVSG